MKVRVIGGGLAGVEAAAVLAGRGHKVLLSEQKPVRFSPAHHDPNLGELVCSNSLKSLSPATGSGLLKEEMKLLGSLILEAAETCKVPAGGALAVDRSAFSRAVTQKISALPGVEIVREEVTSLPEGPAVLATGPLTEGALYEALSALSGECLHFYDAAAPIVTAESVDFGAAFSSSRYGKGGEDYLNCPMTKEEYLAFWEALTSAETVILKDFEKREIFEGCMPVEIMAKRGPDTLRFGPLKPVGLTDPRTGRRPYAVVQLRKENAAGTLFNLVGFQTNLKFPEQRRVFSLIPALKHAEFVKYGVMHRNSYLNAPEALDPFLRLKARPDLFVAGQLSGVEGYLESAATGILCGLWASLLLEGREPVLPPAETVIGSLVRYLNAPNPRFAPMNANFGILPPLPSTPRDKTVRNAALSERAIEEMKNYTARFRADGKTNGSAF